MLDFLGYASTLILYGTLSEKPAGGIKTISFIGKAQTIESFLLTTFLQGKPKTEFTMIAQKAENLFKTELKTEVQREFGFHEISYAIDYYLRNQTAGKILLKPALTVQHKL